MSVSAHHFSAIAFVENLSTKDLSSAYPTGRLTAQDLHVSLPEGGDLFIYPFGAVVFHNATPERRTTEMARLHEARPGLTPSIVREEYVVHENPGAPIGVDRGILSLDAFSPARTAVVALTVAQSAAMEYYETQVQDLFVKTANLENRLEKKGVLPIATRQLHRFVGEALSTRSEVVTVLHLLDKPDQTWDDPALDGIYDDLRAEFDLAERYISLEMKLKSVLESLETMIDVARDRRMTFLELAVVLLIVLEIVMGFIRAEH